MQGPLAHAMADVRGALGYLADGATDVGTSSAYEHVLLTLDAYTVDAGPCTSDAVLDCPQTALAVARRSLLALGGGPLNAVQVELLFVLLDDAAARDFG